MQNIRSGLAVAVAMAIALPAAAAAADLAVEVHGAASAKGQMMVALFDGPAQFLGTPAQGAKVAAGTGPVVVVFHGVKPGTYAVSAFHDENDNGTLDKNLLGLPVEKYGFSRDAAGRMGPPSFDAASFAVAADNQTIVVNLR